MAEEQVFKIGDRVQGLFWTDVVGTVVAVQCHSWPHGRMRYIVRPDDGDGRTKISMTADGWKKIESWRHELCG